MASSSRRIFCVEGAWSPRLTDRESVLPLLTFVRGLTGLNYIHRYVDTVEGFEAVVKKWPQSQYERFSIGYFAFHGGPGALSFGRKWLELEDLAELLEGQCAGKVIYFGSCSVLDVEPERVETFLKATKLKAVCGYRKDVDWFESASFDLLLMERLINAAHVGTALRQLGEWHGDFVHRLGFKAYTS